MQIINTEYKRKPHYKFKCDKQEALIIINDLCKQMIKDNTDFPENFMTGKGEYISFEVEKEIDPDDIFEQPKPKHKNTKKEAREVFNAMFS